MGRSRFPSWVAPAEPAAREEGQPEERGAGATYLSLDGLSIMDGLELDPAMTFSQEMVQEFQISTINYQVGPAVTSLGAVNVVSRSGSNDLHGSAFYFYRDHNLSAYPGLKRIPFSLSPYFSRKDSGFWLGGPIVKNRAFFFFDFEPQKQIQAVPFQPDLPHHSRHLQQYFRVQM